MKRLSLAELKAQSGNVVENLEAIKGGNTAGCHCSSGSPSFDPISAATITVGTALLYYLELSYNKVKTEVDLIYQMF